MDDKLTMHHSMFAENEKVSCVNCHSYYPNLGCARFRKIEDIPTDKTECFEINLD